MKSPVATTQRGLRRRYLHADESVSGAKGKLAVYFDFYNRPWPHTALNRQTPDTAYFTKATAFRGPLKPQSRILNTYLTAWSHF